MRPMDREPISGPVVAPSREDSIVTGASQLVGGPVGRHAVFGRGGFWTPARVLIAMVLATCCLGWAQKLPCRNPANWQHEFQYTRLCYSDVEALLSELPDHVADLVASGAREPGGRALATLRVHAHVERTVVLEAEAAGGFVELR